MQICACTSSPWHQQQAEIFLKKGMSFIEIGQYNSALKELMEAAKYDSGNHKVHYFMGLAYHGKGMRDKAIAEFKEAISLKEDYSEAHNYLGALYLEMELWDQAIAEFDRALDNPIYDTPAMALYNAGWAYYSKKDYKMSLAKYQEALRREPYTLLRPQIEKNIGFIYFDQGDISGATGYFERAVKFNSSLYDAQFKLGECYLKVRNLEKARKAFQTVVKLAPQSSFGQKAKLYLESLP